MAEYTPTTEDIALGYALHEAREAGITDPSERLIFVAGLYDETVERLAAHDAEVARQAEARAWDEGAEAVYWWAEDEVNDLRPAGVIPRHIREANPYRVTDAEGAT